MRWIHVTINAAQGVPDEATRVAGYEALTAAVDIIWDNDPSNPTNSTARLLGADAKGRAGSSPRRS